MSSSLQGGAGLTLDQETCLMMQSLRVPSLAPATVKIWTPPEDRPTTARELDDPNSLAYMRLREVFESLLRPILETDGIEKSTLDVYRNALSHWERLTNDPPIIEITTDELLEFRKAAKLGHKPQTCNKWFRHLRAILNHLGPRSRHDKRSRYARNFYQEVPWLDDLEETDPEPVEITEDQINAIYEHCHVARWPLKARTNCEPTDWWRAVVVLGINYGPRRDDWYRLPSAAVSFHKGTFTYVAKKTGKRHELVLNDVVTWHLQRLGFQDRASLLTPTQSHRQLYREWHRIQNAAGVSGQDSLPFDFHALRHTCAARYHEHFPGTAEILLGHALPRNAQVTAISYLGKQLLKPVWNAIRNIPQPSAFVAAMKTPN